MRLEVKVLKVLHEVDASADEITKMVVAKPERVSEVLNNLLDMGLLTVKPLGGKEQVFTYP